MLHRAGGNTCCRVVVQPRVWPQRAQFASSYHRAVQRDGSTDRVIRVTLAERNLHCGILVPVRRLVSTKASAVNVPLPDGGLVADFLDLLSGQTRTAQRFGHGRLAKHSSG
jgi:hypothetical protein